MLRTRLGRVTMIECDLNDEGSCGINVDRLAAARFRVNRKIVWIDRANRITGLKQ